MKNINRRLPIWSGAAVVAMVFGIVATSATAYPMGGVAVMQALKGEQPTQPAWAGPDPFSRSQVTGTIAFQGRVTLDAASAGQATGVTSWSRAGLDGPTVSSRSGDFASFVAEGDSALFTGGWSFNSGSQLPALWSVGGFTFRLAESGVAHQSGGLPIGPEFGPVGLVEVTGSGWLSGNGFLATFGTWNFIQTDDYAGGLAKFWFSALPGEAPAAVPEGGSGAALLGLAFLLTETLRRKLRRS
jgi:hypothetical protein